MAPFYKKYKLVIFIVAIVVVFLAIGVNIYTNNKLIEKKLYEEQLIIIKEQRLAERQALEKLFDIYLNEFRVELQIAASSYKKSRRVLNEILNPDNFETPEFSKENYDFFISHIAPDLREKSEAIINVFTKYRVKLTSDIERMQTNIGQEFLAKWQEMEKEQLNNYIDFFAKEEQLTKAYEEALKFYYIHSKLFSLDLDSGNLLFDREEDSVAEKILLDKISELRKSP